MVYEILNNLSFENIKDIKQTLKQTKISFYNSPHDLILNILDNGHIFLDFGSYSDSENFDKEKFDKIIGGIFYKKMQKDRDFLLKIICKHDC